MDSTPTRDKTEVSNDSDSYNESLEWIRSMNLQLKSPGNFVSSRLESASLEQVHREFSSLLLTSQSHGSSLLRTAFTNANSYNDNLKKIIMSLWPVKDKVSESYNFLKGVRDESLQISESVNTLLKRLHIVLYAKMAISTILQAQESLNNLCEELVDTFSLLHTEDRSSKYCSKLSHVVSLIETISKRAYKMNTLIQNLSPDYNLESNWVLLEFAPTELKKIKKLVERFKLYDRKLGEMLASLTSKRKAFLESQTNLNFDSNLHTVIYTECQLDSVVLDRLNEFSINRFEADVGTLSKSLGVLIEICANICFTKLYKLYTDLNCYKFNEILTNDDSIQKDRMTNEIGKYNWALVSIVRGHGQLNGGDLGLMVEIFNDTFLTPYLEGNNLLSNAEQGSKSFLSVQEESCKFPKFVESVDNSILNPHNSIVTGFLNDLSDSMGDDGFKSLCVLGPVAKAVLRFVDESYPAIFTPMSAESHTLNYQAFERLITLLETHADCTSRHLLKWRGTALPHSFTTRFSTGVICDNFVQEVCSKLHSELEKHNELDGTFRKVGGRRFYVSSTYVLYSQVLELFSDKDFFHNLFPQYLKGLGDMFKAYIHHIDTFISHMESTNKEGGSAGGKALWPSGLSFAYSTYVLHDVLELVGCLGTGDLNECRLDKQSYSVNFGEEFGDISKVLLKTAQKPVSMFVSGRQIANPDHDYVLMWNNCLRVSTDQVVKMDLEDEFAKDMRNMSEFTIRAMQMLCEFLDNLHEHMCFVTDKLEHYVVSSLYTSSKCSLQFIQSLSSKYRTSNKQETEQVSDYVRFLLAPMCSFAEFGQDVITEGTLKSLMLKTIQLVSADYVSHIAKLLKSVETLNSSLMNTKNIPLSEYSESFLIVDMEMLRGQISKDVGEFYHNCVNKFKVDRHECSSLDLLLQYRL